jgi:hypothetical protein
MRSVMLNLTDSTCRRRYAVNNCVIRGDRTRYLVYDGKNAPNGVRKGKRAHLLNDTHAGNGKCDEMNLNQYSLVFSFSKPCES